MSNTKGSKIRVAVFFGGVSSEHEVSLMSVVSILQAIPTDKYQVFMIGITKDGRWLEYTGPIAAIRSGEWEEDSSLRTAVLSPDRSHKGILLLNQGGYTLLPVDICFPVLHGKNGEDGTIQGLFQLAGMPFVGCDLHASADCMDKEVTHRLLESNGVPMARWMVFHQEEWEQDGAFHRFALEAEEQFGYPMFVKPASAGSSVGVSKAKNREELRQGLQTALWEDKKAIVEEYIDGLEVETAVLGNEKPKAAGFCGEITPVKEFYTYEGKYLDGSTELNIPARVEKEVSDRLLQTAERAFRAIGCAGLARVDFFVRRHDQKVILNEINTLPGFTSISMYPKLWDAVGVGYTQLVDQLIQLGLNRAEKS